MHPSTVPALPHDDDGLANLHHDIAGTLGLGIERMGETLALTFGEDAAQATLRGLLTTAFLVQGQQLAEFDRTGWRAFLRDTDLHGEEVELSQRWRDAAEYAGQGIAPREPPDEPVSLADRERRVRDLVAYGQKMLMQGATFYGTGFLHLWTGVAARAALDFGGRVTLDGVHLLSGISPGAMRNAVSLGELRPDAAGTVSAEQARTWLARRREFRPSRWRSPADNQVPFEPGRVTEADADGNILVPQDADGTPFTPEHVVRPARSGPGLSVTTGAKGAEQQHRDFYAALTTLAAMDVARWRRRNPAGNWGIVRARGTWVSVSKAEVDRQLAAALAPA